MKNMEQFMTMGNRLEYLRESRNMSREALAERFKISSRTIYNFETDASEPRATILFAYHDFFRVSIDWIITGKETAHNYFNTDSLSESEKKSLFKELMEEFLKDF